MASQARTSRWPARFTDRLTEPLPSTREVVRMVRESRGLWRLRAGECGVPVSIRPSLPRAEPGQTLVTWIGHSTYVIQIGGLTVLTDPVWSRRVPGVPVRVTPPGLDWNALPRVDAVMISHNHYDHLDGPTVDRLPKDTRILAPANLGGWFRWRGFTDVTELGWWETCRVGEVGFDFVPAHHWSRRGLFDTCRSLWGGWVLTGPEGRLYFAGDSAYGHWFGEIGLRYPGIDLTMMPIGSYEPAWFMRSTHVNPEEAVQAAIECGATRMATMHWGTFILSTEPLVEPAERAAKAWASAGRPRDHLWDLAVGETRTL